MNDTIFNLLIASLVFWSCFMLCDLSLKRTSSGLYIYLVIIGIYLVDCALYYFTSFSSMPYIWFLFALFPIFVLPLFYKNQLTTIIYTYASSLLFNFMIYIAVQKIALFVIYMEYPKLYIQLDKAMVVMIAMALYLICVPAFLQFAFVKIAKRATERAMWLTWLFPIICLVVLVFNDYQNTIYTTIVARYMSTLLSLIMVSYVMFYMMLTAPIKIKRVAAAPVRLDRPKPQLYTNTNEDLVLFEKQYFEGIINSYNDTLDRAYAIDKNVHTAQQLIHERNSEEAMRYLDQIRYHIHDIQLLEITGNNIVDTLLSYYHYMFAKDEMKLDFDVRLPIGRMRDLDLCILFGGLLQNAYDLLYECKIKHGNAFLECKMHGNKIQITCSSSYIGSHEDMRKAEKNFNLRSVRELCASYRGQLHLELQRDTLYVYTDLYL